MRSCSCSTAAALAAASAATSTAVLLYPREYGLMEPPSLRRGSAADGGPGGAVAGAMATPSLNGVNGAVVGGAGVAARLHVWRGGMQWTVP